MADKILFEAKVGDWVCVKKGELTPGVAKIDLARLLASIQESMSRKTWDFMKDDYNLEELDKIAFELAGAQFDEKKKEWLVKGKVSEQQIATALAALSNPGTTKKMGLQGKNKTELAKYYLTFKVLDLLGVRAAPNAKAFDNYINEKAKAAA